MKRPLIALLLLIAVAALLFWLRPPDRTRPPLLVATLPPLHALAAGVMKGVESPRRLLPPGASPHRYALRPSDASALQSARVVAWIGPMVETFLSRQLGTLPEQTRVVTIADLPGLTLLPARTGGMWPAHDDEKADEEAAHGDIDGHLWLDPANAMVIVDALAETLATTDPANAANYRDNARRMVRQLTALDLELQSELAPLRGKPYVVYHDAYRYFEARYGLTPVAAVTASEDSAPGARRLSQIRDLLGEGNLRCLFAEPQFEPALAGRITEGTLAEVAPLDPVGADLAAGETLYFELLRGLSRSLQACLSKP